MLRIIDRHLPSTLKCWARLAVQRLMLVILCMVATCTTPANAQVTWTAVDIGGAATGTYSSSSGTYTVGGAGTGIAGTSDSFRFVYYATSGNVEMITRVYSQTNTSNYCPAGLMIRGTTSLSISPTNAAASQCSIVVTPKNGINFVYRPYDFGPTLTVLGPSITAPVYLRLARSGNTIAGFWSSDGINWSLVGQFTYPYPGQNYLASNIDIGFAVCSNANPSISTAVFDHMNLLTNVPQRSANLLLWLRADAGVTYNSSTSKVSGWQDQTQWANNAKQTTSGNQPTIVTGALNGLPALSFSSSSSQYMTLDPAFSSFAGAQVFIVVAPGTQSYTPARLVDLGNGSASNNLFMQIDSSSTSGFGSYSGSTSSEIVTGSGSIGSSFVLLEGIQDGSGNGTFRINGTINVTGSLYNPASVLRSNNYIAGCSAGSCYFNGQIAEILVYNAPLSTATRQSVESYFGQKYNLPIVLSSNPDDASPYRIASYPKLQRLPFKQDDHLLIAQGTAAPTISPSTGIYSGGQSVTMTAGTGSTIYYTLDGTTPTTSSPVYSSALSITTSKQINAVAYVGGIPSTVTTAFLTIDPLSAAVPRSGQQLWLRSDAGVVQSSGTVSRWADNSGAGNDATQTSSGNQPAFVSNSLNGEPSIATGSGKYFSLPSGFAGLNTGASIFAVFNPTSAGPLLDLGNGSASNNVTLGDPSTSTAENFTIYNGTTSSSVTATGAITTGQFQSIAGVQNASGSGTIFQNGQQKATGTLATPNNISRTMNHVGANYNASTTLSANIAEVMLWNRPLTTSEQAAVNGYLLQRYQLAVAAVPPAAPLISVATGTLTAPTNVAIATEGNYQIKFTTDGSAPSLTNGSIYSSPVSIYYTQTLKAIAINGSQVSSVSSATYTLNSTTYPAPGAGGPSPQANLQLPVDAIQQP